eukprot:6166665-Heterocapsa_arctica.AAC.1
MDGVIITPKNMYITNEIKSGFLPIGFVQHKVFDIELADKNQLAKKDDSDMQLQELEKERVTITPMDG